MSKKITYILLAIVVTIFAQTEKSWLSPNSKAQLQKESKDDQLGHGRLFIPSLSFPDWEPEYRIYGSEGLVVTKQKTGQSLFLKPGKYRFLLGSAQESFDLFQKDFVIEEQQTTIIEPTWSGLIVKVIDENREGVRFGYEIFHYNSEISLGVKYSKADNEYDDTQSTWLLPPGKYKLTKYGEPYNTLLNFTTFELKPGVLTMMTVVQDSKSGFIVGAGELPQEQYEFAAANDWRSYLYLRGQFSYTGNNKDDQKEHNANLDFKGKIDNHLKYDKLPYYLSLRQSLESGLNKTNSEDAAVSVDELKFDNTFIYYFTPKLGIYTDLDLTTKIFPNTFTYNNDKNSYIKKGDTSLEALGEQNEFQLSPSFYPLSTREEFGLNFSIIRNAQTNIFIRTGFGLIQKQNSRVYNVEIDSAITFTPVPNQNTKGFTFSGGLDLQILNNITYTSEGNLLYSLDKNDDYDFNFTNNLKFKFLKYISLDYALNLNYNSLYKYLKYDNRMALEFSYYLNY